MLGFCSKAPNGPLSLCCYEVAVANYDRLSNLLVTNEVIVCIYYLRCKVSRLTVNSLALISLLSILVHPHQKHSPLCLFQLIQETTWHICNYVVQAAVFLVEVWGTAPQSNKSLKHYQRLQKYL